MKRGFTLIELLIVVAIIAILAAIAVPNFLEAQTRAKVSRTLSDMRSLKTAIESYRVDNNRYPPTRETKNDVFDFGGTDSDSDSYPLYFVLRYRNMTTPIAYITDAPKDVFGDAFAPELPEGPDNGFFPEWPGGDPKNPTGLFDYWTHGHNSGMEYPNGFYNFPINVPVYMYQLRSYGPDQTYGGNASYYGPSDTPPRDGDKYGAIQVEDDCRLRGIVIPYDPTNGTISTGDIMMYGPGGGKNGEI